MADINTLNKVQDLQLADTFGLSAQKLVEMFGGAEMIPANPGETLKVRKITGILSTETYTEGAVIPASAYTTEDVTTKEIELKPYRKPTTLQEIQKRGYDVAVDSTDRKVLSDIQKKVKDDFMAALATGTGTASGTDMLKAAAKAWATLQNGVEEYGFGDVTPIFYANPTDFADVVGKSEVFSAFGMQYIQGWAGLGNLVSTSAVPAGTLYCTAVENIKVYYIPASNSEGFAFTQDESGVVAVAHEMHTDSLSIDTVAWTAITPFPEYADLVVKATIAAA